MLTFEDCIGLCGLTPEEVRAIAEHERVPEIAAAAYGDYLVRTPEGEQCIRAMIVDDIACAAGCGDRAHELALKLVLRDFILQHPRCERRHREALGVPERRAAGGQ